jgi:hypothetical protein
MMDTFEGEFWKSVATKVANKASSSSLSPIQNNQYVEYLSNFQGFGNIGPYNYPSQFYSEPSFIPKSEDKFGVEIYRCQKCSAIELIIVSFSDGQEGGLKMSWSK